MAEVGFTTDSIYKSKIRFGKVIKLYRSLGADAIELSFATPDKLFGYNLSEQAINDVKKFSFTTIHAPWKEVIYDENPRTEKIMEKLKLLCDNFSAKGIVLHPDDFKIFYTGTL